jgi:hypothetical protein
LLASVLRMYFVANWFNLAGEDALYDIAASSPIGFN